MRNRQLPPRNGLGLARAPVLTFFDGWVGSAARWRRVSSPGEDEVMFASINRRCLRCRPPEPKPFPAANPCRNEQPTNLRDRLGCEP